MFHQSTLALERNPGNAVDALPRPKLQHDLAEGLLALAADADVHARRPQALLGQERRVTTAPDTGHPGVPALRHASGTEPAQVLVSGGPGSRHAPRRELSATRNIRYTLVLDGAR